MLVLSVLCMCLMLCEAYDDGHIHVELMANYMTKHVPFKMMDTTKSHECDSGVEHEFKCIYEKTQDNPLNTLGDNLHWKDSYGFSISRKSVTTYYYELVLKLVPYEDEDELTLTCVQTQQNGFPIQIPVTLTSQKIHKIERPGTIFMYIEDQSNAQILAPCNGTIFRMDKNKTRINKDEIFNIEDTGNGTYLICVIYIDLPSYENVAVYNRSITKYMYYLKYKTVTTEVAAEGTFSIKTTPNTRFYNQTLPKSDETSSSADIVSAVSGCLGAIIFLLITIILYMCYRKKQRNVVNEMHVIYADLVQRPTQNVPPLPRRNDPPYAKILGTLVPKHLANGSSIQPNRDEPLYCTVE